MSNLEMLVFSLKFEKYKLDNYFLKSTKCLPLNLNAYFSKME